MTRPANWKSKQGSVEAKSVVITGGSTGIGKAIALMLAAEKAKVFICARNEKDLRATIEEGAQYGQILGTVADVSDHADVLRIFSEAQTEYNAIDILVNNAATGRGFSMLEDQYEDWEYSLETNLLAYMDCAHEAIARMEQTGWGHIVNIGSMSSVVRESASGVYVAAKAGIQAWSESLRKAIADKNIKVSLIEPGLVGTDLGDIPAEKQQELEDEQKMLTAEDVAEAVFYVLTNPQRADVVSVQIRPHLQKI
jgi:NADP-dependent 3-hydroxy acid dehydrogenase YdfG